MRCPAAVLALLASSTAMADDVEDLVASGEALAKRGEYSRAIEAFKQADARRPRALHACLIALSYTRRELWAQAEIALASCHARAGAGDPLPPWVDALDQTLAAKLEAVEVAPISIRVEPPSPSATIAISSFSPDETFAPRVIHLAPGTYTVTASVPGRGRVASTVVVADRAPQAVTLRFAPRERPSRVPWLVAGAGGLLAAGGLAYDLLAVQPARSRLADAAEDGDGAAWVAHGRVFDRRRAVAIGLFAGAAIAVGVGATLRFTVYRREVAVAAGANGVALVGAM
jgi:tetratricopeptide (TPR) repeat protein